MTAAERAALAAVITRIATPPEAAPQKTMGLVEARETMLPGQVAIAQHGRSLFGIIGRVQNDGSTRQQRRAAARGAL